MTRLEERRRARRDRRYERAAGLVLAAVLAALIVGAGYAVDQLADAIEDLARLTEFLVTG